jgi:hypothetical protein
MLTQIFKVSLFLFLVLLSSTVAAQTDLVGKYQINHDLLTDILQLKEDYTYEYISQSSPFPSQNYTGIWHIKDNKVILLEYAFHRKQFIVYK